MRYTIFLPVLLLSCPQPAVQPSLPAESSPTSSTGTPPDKVYLTAEKMPGFAGNLANYLDTTIRYPEIPENSEIGGRAITSFIVRRDGQVTDVETVRSSGNEALDAEAVRVISGMKSWTSGTNGGVPVDVKFTLPIRFEPGNAAQ